MSFSEQLKAQLDVVEVVGHYVRLRRQGSRYVGLCPFHSEKTPSFGVHVTEQYYKCFGCDAAGDVFTFVQQIEGLSFPDTLKLLADQYSISIEPSAKPKRRPAPEVFAEALLFQIGFGWALERYLELLKEIFLLDWDAPEARDIAPLTKLLRSAQAWSGRTRCVQLWRR